MQDIDFSFLVASGRFTASIPDELDPAPDASTVVLYGGGAREMGYMPRSRLDFDTVFGDWIHRFDADYGGTTVSVFARPEDPPTLSAVWHLSNGYLETWVDEDRATVGDLETIIRSVSIADGRLPRVTLGGPIQRAGTRITSRDTVGFYAASKVEGLIVRFVEEPGRSRAASPSPVSQGSTWSETYAIAGAGVRVVCGAPPNRASELRALAKDVADSVVTV